MIPEDLLPCSQESASKEYPEPVQRNSHPPILLVYFLRHIVERHRRNRILVNDEVVYLLGENTKATKHRKFIRS